MPLSLNPSPRSTVNNYWRPFVYTRGARERNTGPPRVQEPVSSTWDTKREGSQEGAQGEGKSGECMRVCHTPVRVCMCEGWNTFLDARSKILRAPAPTLTAPDPQKTDTPSMT